MNFKQIAIDCGLPDFNNENYVECFLDIEQLEAFAKAILASEQEPVAWAEVCDGDIVPSQSHDPEVSWTRCVQYATPLYLHPSQDKIELIEAENLRLRNIIAGFIKTR